MLWSKLTTFELVFWVGMLILVILGLSLEARKIRSLDRQEATMDRTLEKLEEIQAHLDAQVPQANLTDGPIFISDRVFTDADVEAIYDYGRGIEWGSDEGGAFCAWLAFHTGPEVLSCWDFVETQAPPEKKVVEP